MKKVWPLFCLCLSLVPRALPAQEAQRSILAGKLRGELVRIADETPGVLGAAVVDLATGERVGVNDTLVFPQGSAIKVPLLIELHRQAGAGRLRLDDRVTPRAADRTAGSGVLQYFGDGTSELSLRDLATLMIVLSDNTATNLLIERVGMASVNRTLEEMGFRHTRLQRMMIRPRESARGMENLSTPAEAAELMARLDGCRLPVSAAACAEIRRTLEIPKEGAFPAPIPAGVRVAWKPGDLAGVATAWGVVTLPGRPYAVAVMVAYSDDAAAAEAVRRVSAAAYAHFARLAGATPYGTRVDPTLLADTARAAPPR
ncbi:MAG: serine hydrolase [Gemmatimonadetes bacterium]|nr:serine hydrolase [Gemmatimonadota bacterium]